jgi:hypothetical protein
MIQLLKRPWKKPTILFFSNLDNVERRIESIQKRIEILRTDYIRNPEQCESNIDIMLAYSQELTRLQTKHREFLKLTKYEFRTA